MEYKHEIQTIIDLRQYALVHNGDEKVNESKWDKAESLVRSAMDGLKNLHFKDEYEKDLKMQMYQTVLDRLGDLIGYEVVQIQIEGCCCITKRINDIFGNEICEKVFPYDSRRRYPMQEIECVYEFKRYYD